MASLAHQVEFHEDQLILRNGQRSTHFYLRLSGSVGVEARTAVYNISIQTLERGNAFGWSSFLNHHDTLFQVRAREASSGLCFEGAQLSGSCEVILRKYARAHKTHQRADPKQCTDIHRASLLSPNCLRRLWANIDSRVWTLEHTI